MPVFSGVAAITQGRAVPVAWVHWRREHAAGAEFFIEARVEGSTTLLPCRRANRIEDPYGVYFIDGQPWCSFNEVLAGQVQAQLVGADIRESSPEMVAQLLPQIGRLLSQEIS